MTWINLYVLIGGVVCALHCVVCRKYIAARAGGAFNNFGPVGRDVMCAILVVACVMTWPYLLLQFFRGIVEGFREWHRR